jgi:hypothetical protein
MNKDVAFWKIEEGKEANTATKVILKPELFNNCRHW